MPLVHLVSSSEALLTQNSWPCEILKLEAIALDCLPLEFSKLCKTNLLRIRNNIQLHKQDCHFPLYWYTLVV